VAVKDVLGEWGERRARDFLVAAGMELLECNWRCASGEIDIIARDGGTVVFCEVKTRSSNFFGTPAEAVDRRKLARLRTLASLWLAQQDRRWADVRIDVVSVLWTDGQPADITHLQSVS
jgi:putative endonuclease